MIWLVMLKYTPNEEEVYMDRRKTDIYPMVLSGILLSVGLVLPYLTGQIQAISRIISPLHIPALLCGLCCGWKWGLGLGLLLPILRGTTLGMPPFPAVALPMAFELGAYGLAAGLVYPLFVKLFNRKNHLPAMVAALVVAMVAGRVVGGAAKAALLAFGVIGSEAPFTFAAFFAAYFASTAAGAAIHLVLIPAIVLVLENMGLSPLARAMKKE